MTATELKPDRLAWIIAAFPFAMFGLLALVLYAFAAGGAQ